MSNIILPNRELHVATKLHVEIKGFFRFRTINAFSGKCRIDTGWFENTILTSGREVMATRSDWMTYLQVGTDGNFPATLPERQAETSLGSHFAGTNNVVSTTTGQSGTAPYYGWKRKIWRFLTGTVAETLSEVGVGWGSSGSTLISRAPILDPILQTPTSVTPLADEMLEVLYELRYYSPTADVNGPQVTLDGVVYDTITRAANVTGSTWSASIGSAIGADTGGTWWQALDGDIGTVLTGPSGTGGSNSWNTVYNSGYSANSYSIDMHCLTGINGWNIGLGIRSIKIRTTAGEFQTQFNAVSGGGRIPKTAFYTMHMSWTLSWAEKV